MGIKRSPHEWLFASMSPTMRRVVFILTTFSCALIVACAVMLVSVRSHTLIATGYTDLPAENAEQQPASDDADATEKPATDTAAETTSHGQSAMPWTFLLAGGILCAVFFFVAQIYRVNASISDIQRTIRK